jgi:ribonuclease R
LVEVTDWSENRKNPVGKIISVIGEVNNHNAEIHSILYEYDLSPVFPEIVTEAAKKTSLTISGKEINSRKDLRGVDTFTIDPDDAKDFDDALSVRKLESGNWEIGVHIADVSHFVKKGGVLDLEAKQRASSVYLVDRVVPMLPEVISNEICSLKPNKDRLCFSVLFTMDEKANLLDYWVGKSVIHSDKRFTYADAQEIIDKKKGLFSKQLLLLNKLSKILRKARFKLGALDFESSEAKFILNEKDVPVEVYFKPILDTNHMIEEFMLLANKTIATLIGKPKNKTLHHSFVYRIHDVPVSEKISSLGRLVKNLGYRLDSSSKKNLVYSLNNLHKHIKGSKEQAMLEKLIIRSMAKAVYSTNNIGHYGLGFDYYTHFTSPIRRYPDLIVHRLLEQFLEGKNSVSAEDLEVLCKHCSEMEKRAAMAERASIKYMQVKYMQSNVGKTFSGIISGVTDWGLYVELSENKCEGLVKIKSLKEDYFIYEVEKFALIGVETKVQYQLGQNVKVKVKAADLEKRQLNFTIV